VRVSYLRRRIAAVTIQCRNMPEVLKLIEIEDLLDDLEDVYGIEADRPALPKPSDFNWPLRTDIGRNFQVCCANATPAQDFRMLTVSH